MKRLFSGNRALSSSVFESEGSLESNSYKGSNTPDINLHKSPEDGLSEELIPIITLLTAHTHRRYQEGILMILHDLKSDGTQAKRKWKEAYGVLIGTQVALWDTNELVDTSAVDFKKFACKPTYINLTDASMKPIDAIEGVSNISNKKLENILVVSTTLKNRYFLQFENKQSFSRWTAAIRLSLYENTALQEAYTAAFLSSRGSRLSDIKVILASTKFDYEDWVSVRFGTGMPWRRCYAVITQKGKKNAVGQINFYENEKKIKKKDTMAIVSGARAIYAVYPSSPKLIDTSTIIKVEGTIKFEKVDTPIESNVFIMPEIHNSVQGYDTNIRFLIPALNAFQLYGRPKRLIANKDDPKSLLFALPTLPHIYYLSVDDLLPISNSTTCLQWSNKEWKDQINAILLRKTNSGYSGCGTSADLKSSAQSSFIESGELFDSSGTILSPKISQATLASSPKLQHTFGGFSPQLSPDKRTSPERRTSPLKNNQLATNNGPQGNPLLQTIADPKAGGRMPYPKDEGSFNDNLAQEFNRTVVLQKEQPTNKYDLPVNPMDATVNKSRSQKQNMYGTELGVSQQNNDEKKQTRISSGISSIFNMYGSDETEESVAENKRDVYNGMMVQPSRGQRDDDANRIASEIGKLGAGIQNVTLGSDKNIRNFLNEGQLKEIIDPSDKGDVFDPDFMEQDKLYEYDNERVTLGSQIKGNSSSDSFGREPTNTRGMQEQQYQQQMNSQQRQQENPVNNNNNNMNMNRSSERHRNVSSGLHRSADVNKSHERHSNEENRRRIPPAAIQTQVEHNRSNNANEYPHQISPKRLSRPLPHDMPANAAELGKNESGRNRNVAPGSFNERPQQQMPSANQGRPEFHHQSNSNTSSNYSIRTQQQPQPHPQQLQQQQGQYAQQQYMPQQQQQQPQQQYRQQQQYNKAPQQQQYHQYSKAPPQQYNHGTYGRPMQQQQQYMGGYPMTQQAPQQRQMYQGGNRQQPMKMQGMPMSTSQQQQQYNMQNGMPQPQLRNPYAHN